jgi:uncharacterized protein (TIGR04255 family)
MPNLPPAYNNLHLIEVNYGFQFTSSSPWDSTYFGQYYERIKEHGFTDKQERKGIQIQLSNNPVQVIRSGQTVDDQIIFKDPIKGWAIAMGKDKISFHIIKDYKGWDNFKQKLIIPFYQIYLDLGLGKGRRQSNMIYLNKFTKDISVNLSDYFTIIQGLDDSFGIEANTFIQRTFNTSSNVLITKLNSQLRPDGRKNIVLECGAVCRDSKLMTSNNWQEQTDKTHEPIRNFFEAIITEKLRKEL